MVPIEGYYDWRIAVIVAANMHQNLCTADALPEVYKEYLFRVQSGFAFEYDEEHYAVFVDFSRRLNEDLKHGKKITGEV